VYPNIDVVVAAVSWSVSLTVTMNGSENRNGTRLDKLEPLITILSPVPVTVPVTCVIGGRAVQATKTGDGRNAPQFFDEWRLVNVRSVPSSPPVFPCGSVSQIRADSGGPCFV